MNKYVLFSLILLTFLSLTAVCASDENATVSENLNLAIEDSSPILEEVESDNLEAIDESSDILASSDNEIISEGDNASEDINVEVTNVFNGYENTIKVSVPNATGNVNIVVGDKTYSPEFVDGVAVQTISEYAIGLNNVSVSYNNLTKNTYFKALDGVVTYKTFYDYFDETNGYKLQEYIPNGVTLDFQGEITYINLNKTTDFNILSIIINKPINVISSTKDAFIDFNGKAGSLLGEYQGSKFSINNGGSWSNVTGITIHNTQVWFYNTHHITVDNISVIVEDARIGSGVGATSLRANSTWCTIKNSYFYTRNNGGSSSLVMAWADYCTFDNNTVEVEGNVGNLMYLTTYNVDFPNDVIPNCHNNLTNNRLTGRGADISWMLVLTGFDNLIENNTIYSPGRGIANQWVDTSWYGGDAVPEGNRYINNHLYGGCTMVVSPRSIAYNNYVTGAVSTGVNVIFYNNTVLGDFSANINNTIYDNYFGGAFKVDSKSIGYLNIYNNTISDLSMEYERDWVNIEDNIINTIVCSSNNVVLINNIINRMSLISDNISVINCNISELIIGSDSSNIKVENNTINGLVTVLSNNNIITGNNITSTKDYAIDLRKTTGNIITNNYLMSSKEFGNTAVSYTNPNTIQDNYPIAPTVFISVELVNNFENIVTVTVPNVTGTVTIQVSDRKYSLNLTNGFASQRIFGLDPGNYTLSVKYQDDKSPIYANNETTITVPKIDVYTFEITQTEFMEGNVILPITLPGDADGIITVNGIYQSEVNGNGCSVALNLTEGEYDLTVAYTGSERYADKSIPVHISVAHNPKVVLIVSDISTYYLTGTIKATLTDYNSDPIANETIVFTLNSKTYKIKTNENGVASFSYNLAVGSYKLTAKFGGNENYTENQTQSTVKVLSRFTSNKNLVMDYYDGSKYKVRVIGDNGKPVGANQVVTFKINGVTTKVKTDKNGWASLIIKNLPKKYTVTATYKGQTVKNTVTVKQTLRTSIVGVKKTAKYFNLKATLKTSKNKPIKNKVITFRFLGKNYSAKTNAQGIATVKINKNVIDKLKKGKKYAFTVKYVSNIVKNNVVVK